MLLELSFRSNCLSKEVQVNVILPSEWEGGEPCKTLWLLHGLKGNENSWIRQTSIERYANREKIAVVMPDADRSWYTDTAYGANYYSFITEELPELCQSRFKCISRKREYNLIGGLSMGGYGAMKIALNHPDRYYAAFSLSGSFDITRKGRACNLNEWKAIFGFDLQSPLELEGGRHDLFAIAQRAKESGLPLPRLFLWCGLQDALIDINRLFDSHLSTLGIEHTFVESEGNHSWQWWDLHVQDALKAVL